MWATVTRKETPSVYKNSRDEAVRICEVMDAGLPVLPPRSRLYCMEPIGLGTPDVESLTGYIARLAGEQNVSTGVLFGWELAPLVNKKYLLGTGSRTDLRGGILANSFRKLTKAVNGIGVVATDWRQALETATLRHDLTSLTMLVWRNVLSSHGLLRPFRAWCPICYEERREASLDIYEPLLWALDGITICHHHNRRLAFHCPHCAKQLPLLAPRSRVGYCSKCSRWLGRSSGGALNAGEMTDEELNWQRWVVDNVGELLAAAPELPAPPSGEMIMKAISVCIKTVAAGDEGKFARALQIDKATVRRWRTGRVVPQLPKLLRVCHSVGISLLRFLTGANGDGLTGLCAATPLQEHITRRGWRRLDLDKTSRTLTSALEEVPAPTLVLVARRIGRTPATIRKYFPELCVEIAARHARQIKERWEDLGRKLADALHSEEPPPSITDFARHHQCHKSLLNNLFPELCHKVAERRAIYLKEVASDMRDKNREQIRQAAYTLHSMGVYPSTRRVSAILPGQPKIGSSKAGLDALRSACRELGVRR